MYNGYNQLNDLEPQKFLNWQDFRTAFDVPNDQIATEQYNKGLETGRAAIEIQIRQNSTWGAQVGGINPSYISSYEGIGYHRATADLLRGFLESGAPIVVYRYGKQPVCINRADYTPLELRKNQPAALPWAIWTPDITQALGIEVMEEDKAMTNADMAEQASFTQWLNGRVSSGTHSKIGNRTKAEWLEQEVLIWLLSSALDAGTDDHE